MSIEGKHAYRFGYLKSDEWQAVRLEALVREGAKCQICTHESIHNDAHHIWYPENIWETVSGQLVVLCRPCHGFIHDIIPECKTNDEAVGWAHWSKFYNAIKAWRSDKLRIFEGEQELISARELRLAYLEMKAKCDRLLQGIIEEKDLIPKKEKPIDIFETLRAWEAAYKKSLDS